MNSKAKVISYGDSFVSVPGISGHKKRRKAIKALVLIIVVLVMLAYLKFDLLNRGFNHQSSNDRTTKRFLHFNPCRHVTPEPEIILQEKFDSNDYFFPYSFKQRICAPSNRTVDEVEELKELQTCGTDSDKGLYHCVTRYKKLEVMKIPYPGNLTSKYWKVETIHIAVACECAKTELVKTYGT